MDMKSAEVKLHYRIWALDLISYLRPHHRKSHQEVYIFLAGFKLDCFLSCYLDWLLLFSLE